MKKIILIFGLSGFLFNPSFVFAKPPSWVTPPNKPEITRPVITKTPLPTKKAEIRERLTEKRRELIRQFFTRMIRRLEAAISRLEKLISRIESRLAKLESQGENVAKIREEVENAKTKLTSAKADLELAKSKLETVLASDDPKEAFKEVREIIKNVKTQLIEVHRILVHVIGDIKGLRAGQITPPPTGGPTPTPTP